MKKLMLCFLLVSSFAQAETFKLDGWDQLKLGNLLARIPKEAKVLKVTQVTEPLKGRKERIIFPRWVGALKIVCENSYYSDSEYISDAKCAVDVDSKHEDVDVNYDQFKVLLSKPATVSGMFDSITGSGDQREYRSGKFDDGVNFEGRSTNIFHYYFKCSPTVCDLRFSKKISEDQAGLGY